MTRAKKADIDYAKRLGEVKAELLIANNNIRILTHRVRQLEAYLRLNHLPIPEGSVP